ncbi:hypothetical protein G7072_06880 [Nocardioides sp. HDW12B]|uniref:hypothetical protein n=1 Tax=Nocardioides sp. HDW12B TaxID=2714939 RepID=UPI00140AC3C3|nr:hypothetical protein [Nocardioides sp. HDW12B]QIK66104.1 hypothetical protein G7072_06880 [Nocardioides sp. HDW12B]
MTWLLGQLWSFLLLSALLGAATVVVWSVRRESVEVWEDVPVAPPVVEPEASDPADDEEQPTPTAVGTPLPVDADDPSSPFPVSTADGPAPWEAEELWSRPARLGAGGEPRRPKDEWTEAAENWRSWADEATGRGYAAADDTTSSRDRDLFAADRDLFAADRDEEQPAAAAGPATEPSGYDEPVEVFPGMGAQEPDVFPYARPVEAPPSRDETMDPMDDHEMTDDEREAAEIRRLREQARRGDPA